MRPAASLVALLLLAALCIGCPPPPRDKGATGTGGNTASHDAGGR